MSVSDSKEELQLVIREDLAVYFTATEQEEV